MLEIIRSTIAVSKYRQQFADYSPEERNVVFRTLVDAVPINRPEISDLALEAEVQKRESSEEGRHLVYKLKGLKPYMLVSPYYGDNLEKRVVNFAAFGVFKESSFSGVLERSIRHRSVTAVPVLPYSSYQELRALLFEGDVTNKGVFGKESGKTIERLALEEELALLVNMTDKARIVPAYSESIIAQTTKVNVFIESFGRYHH